VDEDIAGLMEPTQRILKAVEILGGYCITTGNVAKVQECRETLDHI
jgi:hypothetical protein